MTRLLIRWRQLLVLSLLLLCSVGALSARPLSERQARHLAEQFFLQSTRTTMSRPISQQELQLVSAPVRDARGLQLRTLSGEEARYYYIYNRGSNEGFVIIAGDDELTPYIGYATTGRFVVENMPEQLAAFLKACQERINELASSINIHQALQPTRPRASEPKLIRPLLGNIQWNQSAPWDNQTPVIDGEHAPVGCVATAYTQVMRYYQWPRQGKGTFSYTERESRRQHSVDYGATTYDWAHMSERYVDPSQATEKETKALSTLAYHAGVAVEMMYASRGSGTYTQLVARALRDHFRYDKCVSYKSRANYTQATWEQLLRSELIASRPIVYSGTGSGGGHAFVCDGYDANGLFHINWGWGGMSDGYFNLNYLVPSDLGIGGGAGGGYSLGQGAVIGIKPDRTGTSQRRESSVVTTWRFSMRFDKGTLDATANYEVALLDDATPYDDRITYGVTRQGSTDTTYLDQYARNAHIESLYQSYTVKFQKLQLSGSINEGTWDFFLAYRVKDATGSTSWRPCGQHERAKDQYRRTFTISRESNGSYTATEDASANQPKLELVAGSAQSKIAGYEKSQVSLQLRNTGRIEYFEPLYLFARKSGEKMFQPLLNLLPAIKAGGQERVSFDIERLPYGSGDVELKVGYFEGERFISVWSNTVSIQPATDVRMAYVLSSDQPVTANLSTGDLSQIRIRNVGTTTAPLQGDLYYRWELSKGDTKVTSQWTKTTPIPAGGEVTFTPNLESELQKVKAQEGDEITLTATFAEVNNEGYIIGRIPMLEQGSLAVTCTKDHIVGDGVITMTTAKGIGDVIRLAYIADGDVSIEGAKGTPRSERYINYTLTSQQVTMRGDITILDCKANRLTDIDVSHCSSLKVLYCFANEIKGKSMLQLVNSLPDRTGLESGAIIIYSDGSFGPEDNVCLKSDVAIARAKNWGVGLARVENRELKPYRYDGEDPTKTFAVTLTQGDNGTISATGADDLHAVLEGTELTITDSPKKGYELTALTANGEDILATKKLNVREDTEIKATFAKKSYTVTFTKEGKGNLTATKNSEPFTSGSPAHEGDKIVITAQPAEGYQIDKWLIGKEEMEFTPYTGQTTFECTVGTADVLIKATFTKKTYPVTLAYNEHGTISIVEPVDLEAVPYGTTLTVKATGKNAQCELTALTANGKDILSTKQFTVQEATKVQATFVDRTSVETIGGHALRIYPNPAQTFVLIEGLQPANQVSLYSMSGKQLYTGQADHQGALRIDLTALSDGVYLLIGEGWQKRLVVKQ
ncbi:C10 family peptidase [Porphyromonas uenonis]|uniref:C10 family peptidase n=1 Tax=Porphyromonas uenonis TaxID=281920 RepID=UPI00288B2FE7|nr:C10 family peptidase [Porphyromonas uenonis]